MANVFPIGLAGVAPTKTASTGVTTTPTTNLTVFTYTTNGTFFAYQDLTVAASSSAIVPMGDYTITTADSNVKVQVTTDGGTTWADLIAVSTLGRFISDGASVRLNNANAAAKTITALTINGGLVGTTTY